MFAQVGLPPWRQLYSLPGAPGPSTDPTAWVPSADGQKASVFLDFVNNRYWWSGAVQSYASLTATGAPTRGADGVNFGATAALSIPASTWFTAAEGTVLFDARLDWPNSGTKTGFSFGNVGGAPRAELSLESDSSGSILLFNGGFISQGGMGNGGQFPRYGVTWKNGVNVFGGVSQDGIVLAAAGSINFDQSLGSGNQMGRRIFDGGQNLSATNTGRLRTLTIFNRQISQAAFNTLMAQTSFTNLHVLGDSFVNTYSDVGNNAARAIRLLMNDGYRLFTMDGVGGSSLADQATRYSASSAAVKARTLIIMDGGVNGDATANLAALQTIVSTCTSGRWVYVQPSPEDFIQGGASRTTWDGIQSTLLAWITANGGANRYVECLTALKAANDGSAQDLIDVANNIVPTSLRLPGDPIHENNAGSLVRWGQIWNRIKSLGW